MKEVKRITYNDVKPFLLNVHYARRLPCVQYAFGLYVNDVLCGCVTYGQPASPSLCKGVAGEENRKNVIELNRLVICNDDKNNASFLVGRSLQMLPKGLFVVSYADIEGWGHVGYVYQATNFLFTGKTKSRTDKYSEGHSRHYLPNETRRSYRSAKYRYIFLTGDKRQKKQMLKMLKYPIVAEYPKGETRHYDTSNPKGLIE